MWGMYRRWTLSVIVAVALPSSGCATTGVESIDDTAESCAQICGLAVAVVVLIPCAIAGAAGCVMGGCTRCNEGPDPVGTGDDDTTANDRAREPPPPAVVAGADMRY